MSGDKATPEIGNTMLLKDVPLGTLVHNIEIRPGQGAKIALRLVFNFNGLSSGETACAIFIYT